MDNPPAHKAEPVRNALEAAKITYRHLPSCSPDLNPIEPCWSKLKGGLWAKALRTLEVLEAELGPALPRSWLATLRAGSGFVVAALPTDLNSALVKCQNAFRSPS